MKISIGFKLFSVIILILSIFALFVFFFVGPKIKDSFLNIIKEEFSQTMVLVENNFDFMEQNGIYMGQSLINHTQLIEAIIKKNHQKVLNILVEKMPDLKVDNIIILDNSSNIIAQTGLFNNDAKNLKSYNIVHESIKSKKPLSAIERVSDMFVFYTSIPILKENNTFGIMLIGLQISNNVLSKMSSGSSTELAIVGDRAISASSLKLKNGNPFVLLPVDYVKYLLLLDKRIDLLVTHVENIEYFIKAKELKHVDSDTTNASLMMMYNKNNYNKNFNTITNTQFFIIISLYLSLLLSVIVLSFYLKNKFSKLTDGFKRVSNGEYGYKLNMNSNDEFNDLIKYFNKMSYSIKAKDEEITKHAAALEQRLKDIEELKESEKVLYNKATKDFLTGLQNREKFQSMFEFMKDSALRGDKKIALSIMDIDFFKKINDTYGHLEGDEVLKSIANLLSNTMRKDDIIARWGGEEFIIAMQVNNISEAYQTIEKLRKTIERHSFNTVGKLKCSFGLSLHIQNEDKEVLFKRVDKALYDSKENGRNMVTIH